MGPWLLFAVLSLLCVSSAGAEDRAHGLNNEIPVALSPEAYSFFHPTTNKPCSSSDCSTSMPLAAATVVQSTPAQESTSSSHGRVLGIGGIVGISLGFVLAGIIAMGVYYVTIKRRANLKRGNPQQHQPQPAEV